MDDRPSRCAMDLGKTLRAIENRGHGQIHFNREFPAKAGRVVACHGEHSMERGRLLTSDPRSAPPRPGGGARFEPHLRGDPARPLPMNLTY